jgi:hypothetical protein
MRRTFALALAATTLATVATAAPMLTATRLYAQPNGSAAEIPAHDKRFGRLFVASPDAVTIYDATSGAPGGTLDYLTYFPGGVPNSVAVKGRNLALAVQAAEKTDPGRVLVYDLRDLTKAPRVFTVGALPDMVTFTPDGTKVLSANEGEPNSYGLPSSVDPVGSVSIIDLATNTVQTAGFDAFNGSAAGLRASGVRLYGPGASVAQDIEPEYIAIAPDGLTAKVTLQENNAVATIDIASATVTSITPLGFKSYASTQSNTIDPSDTDAGYIPRKRDGLYAAYEPDAIGSFSSGGQTFYAIANEGDAREWANVGGAGVNTELFRLGALEGSFSRLEAIRPALWGATLPADATALTIGGRSFAILDSTGAMVFESGNQFEEIVANLFPGNRDNGRDDNKGAEPEEIEIGRINGRTIVFIGLERANGGAIMPARGLILAYDVTGFGLGVAPTFLGGISDEFLARPEGLVFWRGPGGWYLTAADEQSNNVVTFALDIIGVPAPATLALFGLGLLGLAAARRRG